MQKAWYEQIAVLSRKRLAKAVKKRRALLKLSVRVLAERSDVSSSAIDNIEAAKSNIQLDTLAKVAAGLNLSCSDLLKEYDRRDVFLAPAAGSEIASSLLVKVMELTPPNRDRSHSVFLVKANENYEDISWRTQKGDITILMLEGEIALFTEGCEVLVQGVCYLKKDTFYKVRAVSNCEMIWVVATDKMMEPILWP